MKIEHNINSEIIPILEEIKSVLKQTYGDKLAFIVLYGSYARKEENEASDIDIAVIIKGEFRPYEEIKRIVNATYEVELKHSVVFNFHPISEDTYQTSTFSFHESIKKEGIPI